jgi:WD40 repeat protein
MGRREVKYWLEHRDPNRLLAVVTDGEWIWNRDQNGFDTQRSTAVPPTLVGAFREEPRHIDLRWVRGDTELSSRTPRLRDQVAEIAAPIHGISKEDLIGDDLRQHRRTRRTVRVALALLLVLSVTATAAAVDAARNASRARASEVRAVQARAESDYERLVAQSRDVRQRQQDLALLLAVEARHIHDTPASRGAIQAAILQEPRYLGPIVDSRVAGGLGDVCPLADGRTAIEGATDGTWGSVDLIAGTPLGPRSRLEGAGSGNSFVGCSVDRSSDEGVLFTIGGQVWLLNIRTNQTTAAVNLHHQLDSVVISPDGRHIAAATLDGHVETWSRSQPNEIRELPTDGATDAQAVAFSPDGRTLASTTDTDIVLRDARTLSVVRRISSAPDGQAGTLVMLPEEGRALAFSGDDSFRIDSRRAITRVIDLRAGGVRWTSSNDLTGGALVTIAPDSRSVFINADGGVIRHFDARDGSPLEPPIRPPTIGNVMAVTRDGRTLDGRSTISSFIPALGQRVFGTSPDGRLLIVVPDGSQVVTDGVVIDSVTRRTLYVFPMIAYPTLLDDTNLRGFFISELAVDGVNIRTGKHVGPFFSVPVAGVQQVAIGANGEILVGYEDGVIRLYRLDGRQAGNPWLKVSGSIQWMALSPNGALAAVTTGTPSNLTAPGDASEVRVYRTDDRSIVAKTDGSAIKFDLDGTVLGVMGSHDGLELFDTKTFRLVGSPPNDRSFEDFDLGGRKTFVVDSHTRGAGLRLEDLAADRRPVPESRCAQHPARRQHAPDEYCARHRCLEPRHRSLGSSCVPNGRPKPDQGRVAHLLPERLDPAFDLYRMACATVRAAPTQ